LLLDDLSPAVAAVAVSLTAVTTVNSTMYKAFYTLCEPEKYVMTVSIEHMHFFK